MKTVHFHQIVVCLVVVVILFAPFAAVGEQLEILKSSNEGPGETGEEESEENWNSHIDNQAYLEDFRKRSRAVQQGPVIIINNIGRSNLRKRNCNSWGVDYRTGDSAFLYYDNYRPLRCPPIYYHPQKRPTPYIRKEKNQRVWGTGE